MREQIRERLMIYRVISKITNTNILNEFSDSFKKSKDKNISSIEKNSSFRFENITMFSHQKDLHSFYKSVIYDSRCNDSFTFDRDRFVNEIRFTDE